MTAFTELPPGFAFFAAILVYDLVLLLRGEIGLIDGDPFYETDIQETALAIYDILNHPEASSRESGFEMDGFATGGEIGWDLLLNFDFPDLS